MEEQAWRRLVADYEYASRHRPRRFAWVTALWAGFGYAVILGTLALSLVALQWSLQRLIHGRFSAGLAFLAVASLSVLVSLVRALWPGRVPLEGLDVSAGQAPRLFELIDKVRRQCGAPAPGRVLLNGELNAAIAQEPRLGLLGWHRNTLILGLPLMLALDTRQLAAVIAHEFGHLRGAHGKFGAWIYRTRRSWWRLAESRQQARVVAGWADVALGWFFTHFFPRFNARAFVLSRQQEYEADKVAHRVTGTKAAANGLLSIAVHARFMDECFWPEVFRQVDKLPTPAIGPHRLMHRRLRQALVHQDAGRWLRQALRQLPDDMDTHPSLRDRLAFAEAAAELPEPPEQSAAQALLGEAYAQWLQKLDERWQEQVADQWQDLHRRQKGRRELAQALAADDGQSPLDAEEHLLWARAVAQLEGPDAAIPILRAVVARHPADAQARFHLGSSLAAGADAAGRAEGVGLLRELAEAGGTEFALSAARRVEAWLESHDRFEELKPWRERLRRLEQEDEAAWAALLDFEARLQFRSPGFGKRTLRPVMDMLRREPAVGRAFLVQSFAPRVCGWRLCLLVIERTKGLVGQPDVEQWWGELEEKLDLPGRCMVVDLAHPFWADAARAPIVRQIIETPDACIYAGRRL